MSAVIVANLSTEYVDLCVADFTDKMGFAGLLITNGLAVLRLKASLRLSEADSIILHSVLFTAVLCTFR